MASGVALGHQQEILDDIVELLVAAGYFRARISTLSPFDKVVGGVAWCIAGSSVDIDVDVLFVEESNIGQKIKVAEQIETALRKLKCPHLLRAHQIQGLDFPNIFPVVQWLVKTAFELRQEQAETIRKYSELQFDRLHLHPQDQERLDGETKSQGFFNACRSRYPPKRRFRRAIQQDTDVIEARVQSTLLEYGRRYKLSAAMAGRARGSSVSGKGALSKKADEAAAKQAREQEEAVRQLMSELSVAGPNQDEKVSKSKVGDYVAAQTDMIRKAATEYDELTRVLEEKTKAKQAEDESHRRKVDGLQRQLQNIEGRIQSISESHAEATGRLQNAETKLGKKQNIVSKLQDEMEKLETIEREADPADLETLRNLVTLNENLKAQEKEFKQQCKKEKAEWEERLARFEEELAAEQQAREDDISNASQTDKDKYNKIVALLAKKTQEIAELQRQIEDIPARSELLQYEKRFIELYEQVTVKLDETRKHYLSYNTLQETLSFLGKELSILNSIHEKFEVAMSSKSNRQSFLKQMSEIVRGIEQNRTKVFDKMQDAVAQKGDMNRVYQQLLEAERKYFKTVKEFQEECKKGELLQAQIDQQAAA